MTDPTAQMGFQVGQTALKHGTQYVEQNVSPAPAQILTTGRMLIPASDQPLHQYISPKALFQRI
jgi:hypothetical protein